MAKRAYFEVSPGSDQPDNPYRAQVASPDEEFKSGHIRVEPPFTPYDELREGLQGDVGIQLEPKMSGDTATVLKFYADAEGFGVMSDRERVKLTVGSLLKELGTVASVEAFREAYAGQVNEEEND